MEKIQRQKELSDLIKQEPTGNQAELLKRMRRSGIRTTQASISRDLSELGAVKVDGVYRLPSLAPGQSSLIERLTADRAGDNLIVLKTSPGHAQVAAVQIDKARITEIIGTIAGDDTIFIAVAGAQAQQRVLKKIFTIFGQS